MFLIAAPSSIMSAHFTGRLGPAEGYTRELSHPSSVPVGGTSLEDTPAPLRVSEAVKAAAGGGPGGAV